ITSAISGAGTLNQLGAGTTTLSRSNTYSGATLITNGTLQTTSASALGTSEVQLNAGSLAPVGTLNIESLTWSGGTIASTLGTTTSFVGITNSFTLNPGGGTFAFTNGAGFAGNTEYTILGATNMSSFSTTNFSGNQLFGLDPIFTINGTNLFVNFKGSSIGSIIQNSADVFTPRDADFQVSNSVTTGTVTESNTVNSLTFAPGSSLQVYNRLQVTSGNFTVGTGTATVQGGELFVPGDFTKLGDGLLNLLGQVLVNGRATVSAGGLLINGEFTANSLTVLRNALLGGAGTIFGNVLNNGTVSPGNSPGTLTIVGNYTQGSTGNLAMEIAGPSNFDRLVVSGTATLAGTLTVTTVNGGTLSFGDKYQFLSAGGGISGEFDTIAMPSGFRGRFLTDSSNTQGTLLVAPLSYTQVAVTPNQTRVAKALDAFIPAKSGDRETVSIALDELTAEQYPSAFEAIMPSIYASIPTMAFNVANALNTSMFQRMWMQRVNGQAMSISGMEEAPLGDGKQFAAKGTVEEVPVDEAEDDNWGVFVDANGVFANANSGGLLQNYKSQSGGVGA
ncbi:MAG: autotransporter-associated beta strand repeat-containing protein, partial [Chthoniobacterales bacterium]